MKSQTKSRGGKRLHLLTDVVSCTSMGEVGGNWWPFWGQMGKVIVSKESDSNPSSATLTRYVVLAKSPINMLNQFAHMPSEKNEPWTPKVLSSSKSLLLIRAEPTLSLEGGGGRGTQLMNSPIVLSWAIVSLCVTSAVDWVTRDISLINHHMNSAFERSYVPVTSYTPLPPPPLCQPHGMGNQFPQLLLSFTVSRRH